MHTLICKIAITFTTLCLSGCLVPFSVVPEHMQVDKGIHPENIDEDVRFRTTYYFRVVDYCNTLKNKPGESPVVKLPFKIDSLYRFRMTGKANSLTTNVRFESGILSAAEIDPLGANVAYDKKNRQHYLKTQRETRHDALREQQFEELDRAIEKYQKLLELEDIYVLEGNKRSATIKPEWQTILAHFKALIERQIQAISQVETENPKQDFVKLVFETNHLMQRLEAQALQAVNVDNKQNLIAISGELKKISDAFQDPELAPKIVSALSKTPGSTTDCKTLKRGFQILGPEGWRPFDQNDRLILAMTTDAKPLIATLKEVSKRVLDSKANPAEIQLPLSKEHNRINIAELALNMNGKPENTKDALEKALTAFKEERP